jgi:predicted pyridoxine 5'-phosphate oxidase superfamily flavin-nucleotide-binding protein
VQISDFRRLLEAEPQGPFLKRAHTRATIGAVRLTPDMQRVVLEQSLGFVATVTPDGRPNLSPKGTTTVWDDEHLMFADVASPGTVANLASNPNVEVNVVDPIARKGYRFKGIARVYTSGDMYEQGIAALRARGFTTARERIRSIVRIEVTAAAPVVSPAYDDGTSESEISARWLRRHTELHSQ